MKPNPAADLGCWLRVFLQKNGKTLHEVATSANMNPAFLINMKCGNRLPTEAQASALAESFGIPKHGREDAS